MGRDSGKGSRIITVRPHLRLRDPFVLRGSFPQHVCVCICAWSFVRTWNVPTTYRRRPQMDTISNYLPGSDNTHFSINSPAPFFHPILRTFSRGSFVLSIESGILGANCIFNFTECASYSATKFLSINKEKWKNRSYTILKQIKYIDSS